MKLSEFRALVAATNLEPSSNTVNALRVHLVGGKSLPAAAAANEVSRQAAYVALAKLPRAKCPACRQWLPPGTKVRRK